MGLFTTTGYALDSVELGFVYALRLASVRLEVFHSVLARLNLKEQVASFARITLL